MLTLEILQVLLFVIHSTQPINVPSPWAIERGNRDTNQMALMPIETAMFFTNDLPKYC